MSSKKSDLIIEFANNEIQDSKTRDMFLGIMSLSLIVGDVNESARQYGIKNDHPVWSFIQRYNSLPKPDPIVEFAAREIQDQHLMNIFVELMTVTLLNGDVRGTAVKLHVGNDHAVWPYIWKYFNEIYNLDVRVFSN